LKLQKPDDDTFIEALVYFKELYYDETLLSTVFEEVGKNNFVESVALLEASF